MVVRGGGGGEKERKQDQWALFCSLGRWDTPGLAEWQEACPYRPRAAGAVVRDWLGSGTHPWVDSEASLTHWG